MSARCVNLVGTRAVRGEHDALVRWYADHVYQLMAWPGLLAAALHRRCASSVQGPDYLCLYDFADRAAFDGYERSSVHAEAARDRQTGWGRDGIEITVRMPFERLYWSAGADAPGPDCVIHALRAGPDRERALAVQAALRAPPAHALLRAAAPAPRMADYLVIEPSPPGHADAPFDGCETVWRARYALLRRWWR